MNDKPQAAARGDAFPMPLSSLLKKRQSPPEEKSLRCESCNGPLTPVKT
ncbi:MAG: hypothetical protein ACLFT8_05605 [Desulfovermiculus sp.]